LFLKKRQILYLDSQRRRKSYYTYKGGRNEREREREREREELEREKGGGRERERAILR